MNESELFIGVQINEPVVNSPGGMVVVVVVDVVVEEGGVVVVVVTPGQYVEFQMQSPLSHPTQSNVQVCVSLHHAHPGASAHETQSV